MSHRKRPVPVRGHRPRNLPSADLLLPDAQLPTAEAWAILDQVLPRVLLAGWVVLDREEDAIRYLHDAHEQIVIVSVRRELDGRRWLHLSTSFRTRVPTWEELRDTTRLFLGRERCAVQVIPPESQHVNIAPTALHVWSCWDGPTVPDFTQGTGAV